MLNFVNANAFPSTPIELINRPTDGGRTRYFDENGNRFNVKDARAMFKSGEAIEVKKFASDLLEDARRETDHLLARLSEPYKQAIIERTARIKADLTGLRWGLEDEESFNATIEMLHSVFPNCYAMYNDFRKKVKFAKSLDEIKKLEEICIRDMHCDAIPKDFILIDKRLKKNENGFSFYEILCKQDTMRDWLLKPERQPVFDAGMQNPCDRAYYIHNDSTRRKFETKRQKISEHFIDSFDGSVPFEEHFEAFKTAIRELIEEIHETAERSTASADSKSSESINRGDALEGNADGGDQHDVATTGVATPPPLIEEDNNMTNEKMQQAKINEGSDEILEYLTSSEAIDASAKAMLEIACMREAEEIEHAYDDAVYDLEMYEVELEGRYTAETYFYSKLYAKHHNDRLPFDFEGVCYETLLETEAHATRVLPRMHDYGAFDSADYARKKYQEAFEELWICTEEIFKREIRLPSLLNSLAYRGILASKFEGSQIRKLARWRKEIADERSLNASDGSPASDSKNISEGSLIEELNAMRMELKALRTENETLRAEVKALRSAVEMLQNANAMRTEQSPEFLQAFARENYSKYQARVKEYQIQIVKKARQELQARNISTSDEDIDEHFPNTMRFFAYLLGSAINEAIARKTPEETMLEQFDRECKPAIKSKFDADLACLPSEDPPKGDGDPDDEKPEKDSIEESSTEIVEGKGGGIESLSTSNETRESSDDDETAFQEFSERKIYMSKVTANFRRELEELPLNLQREGYPEPSLERDFPKALIQLQAMERYIEETPFEINEEYGVDWSVRAYQTRWRSHLEWFESNLDAEIKKYKDMSRDDDPEGNGDSDNESITEVSNIDQNQSSVLIIAEQRTIDMDTDEVVSKSLIVATNDEGFESTASEETITENLPTRTEDSSPSVIEESAQDSLEKRFNVCTKDIKEAVNILIPILKKKSNVKTDMQILVKSLDKTVLALHANGHTGVEGIVYIPTTLEGEFEFAFDGARLKELIKQAPDEVIRFKEAENGAIEVSSGAMRAYIRNERDGYFPIVEEVKGSFQYRIDSLYLGDLIRSTSFATSNPKDDRPIFNACYLQFNGANVTMTATDTHHVASKTIQVKGFDNGDAHGNFLIPASILNLMMKYDTFKSDKYWTDVKIESDGRDIGFEFDNFYFRTRLIEGNYPTVSNIIPSEYDSTIAIKRKNLLNTLKRVSAGKIEFVSLSIKTGEVHVRTYIGDEVANHEILPIKFEGREIDITLSLKRTINILNAMQSEFIRIGFNDVQSPPFKSTRFFEAEDADSSLYLLAPAKINK